MALFRGGLRYGHAKSIVNDIHDFFLFKRTAVSIFRQEFSDLVQMFLVSKLGTLNYVDHISLFSIVSISQKDLLSTNIGENFLSKLVAFFQGSVCSSEFCLFGE